MNARTFGTDDQRDRFAAKYGSADYGVVGQAIAAGQREHYVINNGVRHDVPQVATVTPIQRATDRAIQFLVDLSAERTPHVAESAIRGWADSVEATEVSAKIDWLKTQPKALNSGTGAKASNVPAGRYAVTGERGQTVFVKVDVADKGPFKGRTFVRIQASDELIRVTPAARNALLAKIEADGIEQASRRYGRELGHCGVCGRTLTDAESRAEGIGPICRGKMGW